MERQKPHTDESLLLCDPLYVKVKNGASSVMVTEVGMEISGWQLLRASGVVTAEGRRGTFRGAGDVLYPDPRAGYVRKFIL